MGFEGDTGAGPRSVLDALVRFGGPPERYWPVDGKHPLRGFRNLTAAILAAVASITQSTCSGAESGSYTTEPQCNGIFRLTEDTTATRAAFVPNSGYPMFIAAADDTTFLFGANVDTPRVTFARSGTSYALETNERFGLAFAAGVFLVFHGRTISRVDESTGITPLLLLPPENVVVAVAAFDSMVFVESYAESSTVIRRYDGLNALIAGRRSRVLTLAAPSRMTTTRTGGVIAVPVRAPEAVVVTDTALRPSTPKELSTELLASMWSEASLPIAQSVVDVGCSRALLTITDLDSESRWLIELDAATGRDVDWARLSTPQGWVQRIPHSNLLLAVNGTLEPPGLVLYRWHWEQE